MVTWSAIQSRSGSYVDRSLQHLLANVRALGFYILCHLKVAIAVACVRGSTGKSRSGSRSRGARRRALACGCDATRQSAAHVTHICSRNNFPTAAGLASSASGFAALVASLAALYKLPATPSELSLIARQGSGSACRSLFGGYVAWEMGTKPDGSDSLALVIRPFVQDLSALHVPDDDRPVRGEGRCPCAVVRNDYA